ncbi:MAG: transposase [Verrucomicrobiaceae bacterium]|nr:transposase [Verrucomicrobiaceae bacterium]
MTPDQDAKLPWPHAPLHRLGERGIYFVTAATYRKLHHFRSAERLAVLHRGLLKVCADFGWRLEAWAVFSNHYHFVAESPANAESLPTMLGLLHEKTAKWINKLDHEPERKVWHNYRETLLSFERSYFARLNYTHRNAVKHGLVQRAADYPWCSAAWFERHTSPAMVKAITRFKTDHVSLEDEFDVAADW